MSLQSTTRPHRHLEFLGYTFTSLALAIGIGGEKYYRHLLTNGASNYRADFPWKSAQFFMNYVQFGFIKRGLVGSFIHLIPDVNVLIAGLSVCLVSLIILALIAAGFLTYCTRELAVGDRIKLGALVVFSPLTFLHSGYDFGRFDIINLLILVTALAALNNGRIVVASLLNIAGLLIHTLFFLYGSVLLIAFAVTASPHYRAKNAATLWLLVTSCVTSLALFEYGKFELGLHALTHRLGIYYPGIHFTKASLLVWTRPLLQNFSFTLAGFNPILFFGSLLFVALTANLFFSRQLVVSPLRSYSTLAILLAFPLGIDDARWVSLFYSTNLVLLASDIIAGRVTHLPEFNLRFAPSYIALCAFPLGAFGIDDQLFPQAQHLIAHVISV